MLQYHNDLRSTGQNLNETAITYATLNASQFAKQFATPVDGQVFAQPLYMPQLSIVGGPQPGVHDVVFAATEHGSVYAIDAAGGNVLWRTSLIDVANPRVNLLGATTIAPVPSDETHSGDLTPEISITATPVIDPAAGALFVAAKTKQSIAGADHYAQTLFKLDIHSGAVVAGSTFADTKMQGGRFTYRYGDDPFVRGTGAGAVKDPKDTAGESRVYFNALREFGRSALVLDHGRLTECFASHGDNGPYHGWVLQFDPTSLAVVAALNVSPNGDGDGIWQSGAPPAVDERGDLFLEVGNGTFDGNADAAGKTIGLDDAGFPKDGDYGDCFLRITIDPDHPSNDNQNRNGWGLKVADYFSPFNNHALDRRDTDVGSGGVLLLPDAVGADAHRHLLVGAGKEGKIYLLDRDDLGKFDPATDHAVQTLGRSRDSGINASFGVPALFNGSIYYFPGYGGDGRVFHLENGGATLAATCTSRTADRFGALIGTPSISADGRVNGVVWILDRGSNQLRAYRADDLNVRLWSSGDAPHDRDRLGMVTKFSVPTIADGRAFVGTADHLVVYGPPRPPTSAPPPPSAVVAEARAFNLVAIHWQDNASNEDGFHVERSTDGSTWTTVATVSSNETTATDPSTLAQTAYEYRVSAFNGFNGGSSATSTEESKVTTPAAPALGAGDGAAGAYFNDEDDEHCAGMPTMTRVDPTIDFDWGWRSPDRDHAIRPDHFSVRWTGKIQPQYSETYTFYLRSDDGARLWIDGKLLIDDWAPEHGDHEQPGTIKLSAGQKYHFRVEYYEDAMDAEARLWWSSPSTMKQPVPKSQMYSGTAPAVPTELSVSAASNTQADLKWRDNASNETGYAVERKAGDEAEFIDIAKLSADVTSYHDTGLNPAARYTYRVRAINFREDSAPSNTVSLTMPTPPQTPSDCRVTRVTSRSIHLAWEDKSDNEDGYRILRRQSGGTFIAIATLPPNSTEFTDDGKDHAGLPSGTAFDYHVQAYNIAGASDFTGATATTLGQDPAK